jgi:hypothetical protein
MLKINSKIIAGLFVAVLMFVGATSASADWMASTATKIMKGSPKADVMWLQQTLNATGTTPKLVEDGLYGKKTTAAIKGFQVAHPTSGVADGIAGKKTIAALNAAGSNGTPNLGCSNGQMYNPNTGAPCNNNNNTGTQSGPITAMLSTDNPAAGTIVAGQATADLAHITFSGSGTVNSVTFSRGGVSDQNTLSNIYLYDGVQRLTDGYSFNTNGSFTVNNLNLAVNGSRTIAVKADVSSSTLSYDIWVTLTSFSAGTSVNTVSIKGNDMFIAGGSSLASIGLSGANTVSTASVNAGTTSYTVWRQAVQVNTRALKLKAANFRITGSAPSDALANVQFYVDGVKAGDNAKLTMTNGSNYLSFDMTAAPLNLPTGSHTFEVRGDVVKGSSFSFTVSLQQASDIMVMDPQIGVNLAMCGNTSCSTSFAASTSGTISIGTGSFTGTVDPAFSTLTNVTAGASNVTIAKYKIHGYGEDVKVTSLPITPVMTFPSSAYSSGTVTGLGSVAIVVASTTGFAVGNVISIPGATAAVGTVTAINSSTSLQVTITTVGATPSGTVVLVPTGLGLQNVTLYFNGSQVGTQQGWTSGALTFNLGSQMLIPAGVDSSLEVRADLRTSSAGTNYNGGTVAANLGAATAEGWNSHAAITGPTATGTVLSLQSGTLGLSKNAGYASQNASPNTAGVKIGSYVMQNQSTSESIRVTSLLVNVAYGSTTSSANLSGLRTSELSGNASTPVQPATAAASSNANNTFSSDFTLAPGATKTIDIFADSGNDSTSTTSTVTTSLTVTSIGTTSNVSATSAVTVGQIVTFRVGTLGTPSILTSGSTAAQLVAAANGGAADGSLAVYSFTSANSTATITELTFSVTSGTATSIKVGSVSAPVVGGVAYVTGLSIAVPNGGSGVNVNVYVSYAEVGVNAPLSNTASTLTLTTIKSTSGNTTTTTPVSVAAPTMTLVGSKPVVAVTSITTSGLNMGGENKIGEVTVTADAKGNIKVNDIKFAVVNVGFTTVPTFTLARIADGTTTVVGSSCGQGTAAAATQVIFCEFGTVGNTFTTTTGQADVEVNTDFDGYTITAGTSKVFSLYATVTAANTGTNLAQISTSLTAAGFNWDDTSSAAFVADGTTASPANGTNLSGSAIYNFPTGSYTIKQ